MVNGLWAPAQVAAVLFLATLIRSAFGFGEALVAVPLLALLIPVEVAAPVAVLVSITVAFIAVVQDWRHIHVRSAGRLVLSTLFGVPLGLLLLKSITEPVVKAVLGFVIIAFSAYSLLSRREHELKNDSWAWLFGFGAGVFRWRLRNEWATSCDLRVPSQMVSRTVSSDAARVLSARESDRHVRLLDCRLMDSRREPFLHPVTANGDRGYFSGTSDQSTDRGSSIPSLCSLRVDCDWSSFADAGRLAPRLTGSSKRRLKLIRMKILVVLLACLTAIAQEYTLGPDSQRQSGTPQGKVTQHTWTSKIFPGTVRDYWVYVPAQYNAAKPACLMIFQDGGGMVGENSDVARADRSGQPDSQARDAGNDRRSSSILECCRRLREAQQARYNRSYEYDALGDRYARFLLEEILPEVGKRYNLSSDPNDRGLAGSSSGGIAAFTAAWNRPDAFHRVLSFIGSYTNLRGGQIYSSLIRKTEPKPLRVFLQDGKAGPEHIRRQLVDRQSGYGLGAGVCRIRHKVRRRNRGAQRETRLGDSARRAALAVARLPKPIATVPTRNSERHEVTH